MPKHELLKEKYRKIAMKFLLQKKKEHKILCMLLTGSYYSGKISKTSDLDVFLITDNLSNLREKGVKFIEDIKVSYFINPYWKIIELLNSEKGELKRPTAEFIYFSDCVFGNEEEKKLKKLAKATIDSLIPKIDGGEISYLGWKLLDKMDVLKRKNYDKLNKEYLKHNLFELSVNTFFLMKRSYKPHAKYVLNYIKTLDEMYYYKLRKYLEDKSDSNLFFIVNYLLKLLNFNSEDYFKRTKVTM